MKKTENRLSRPSNLKEYVCDETLKSQIARHIERAKKNHLPFPHTLLIGGTGAGNSALAYVIAKEMDMALLKFDGAQLQDRRQLSPLFLTPSKGVVLFIDGINNLTSGLMELLSGIMKTNKMPSYGDKSLLLFLNPVTVIAASTEPCNMPANSFVLKFKAHYGQIPSPLEGRIPQLQQERLSRKAGEGGDGGTARNASPTVQQ